MDELQDLPQWVKTLIEDAYDRGKVDGVEEGQKIQFYKTRRVLEQVVPYGA